MEAEALRILAARLGPVLPCGIEQRVGADDIGLDEGRRTVDRTVDMALGGEMHDRVDGVLAQQRGDQHTITDIALDEVVARAVADRSKRGEVGGVGQLVEIDHAMVGCRDQVAADGRADEACSPSHQDIHAAVPLNRRGHTASCPKRQPVSTSARRGAAASFAERTGSAPPSGQAMPISGSSKRIARSCSRE